MEDNASLLHRVFKARYYPKSDFLEVSRGNNSSFTWRNIWGAKSLLKEGLKWCVGNGLKIRVWEDDWIHSDDLVAARCTGVEFNPDLWVCELICEDQRAWNGDLVKRLSHEKSATQVLSIPLSLQDVEDDLLWWPEKKGCLLLNLRIG